MDVVSTDIVIAQQVCGFMATRIGTFDFSGSKSMVVKLLILISVLGK